MEKDKNQLTSNHLWVFWVIIAISVCMGIIVVGSYFMNFSSGISNEVSSWAGFGDFVGGTLNPIFGFMGLLAILYTLQIQVKEMSLTRDQLEKSAEALEQSKNIAQKELEQIEKEERKNDISRVVKDFYSEIDGLLSAEVKIDGAGQAKERRGLLDDFSYNMRRNENMQKIKVANEKNPAAINEERESRNYRSRYMMYSSAKPIAKLIIEFSFVLKELESLSDSKIVTYFYKKRLVRVAKFLCKHEYLDQEISNYFEENPLVTQHDSIKV